MQRTCIDGVGDSAMQGGLGWPAWRCLALSALVLAGACSDPQPDGRWQVVTSGQPEAILSVAGSRGGNTWFVGADRGRGPLVVRYDGARFVRHDSGHRGDLWWVQAFDDGSALMAGSDGSVLRYRDGAFERLSTPGLGKQTLFGLAGQRPDDVWFVGGAAGRDGFIWHLRGAHFDEVPLPLDVPRRSDGELPSVLKTWVSADGQAWFVGDRGLLLHAPVGAAPRLLPLAARERWFTIAGLPDAVGEAAATSLVAVGGNTQGHLLEGRGGFAPLQPEGLPLLQGVFVDARGAIAVGQFGAVIERSNGEWQRQDPELAFPAESLHAVYRAPGGTVWAVGGNVLSTRLDQGIVLRRASPDEPLPAWPALPAPPPPVASCPPDAIDPQPRASIARRWNEQILAAIRRDLPRPTVHARNLFHLSAAIYDTWVAYDRTALGYLFQERRSASDVSAARREAISYAAYRILRHRYEKAVGGAVSAACFDAFMGRLGFDPSDQGEAGDGPRALGNRVSRLYIEQHAQDGANESADYGDSTRYQSQNDALVVDLPSTTLRAPARWQPLNLSVAATQNGIVQPAGVQGYIGAHWGDVRPFALRRATPDALYVDPGPAPGFDPVTMRPWVVEVLDLSRRMDVGDASTIDISPGAMGNNPLGSNAGTGHAQNPATGQPYSANRVAVADFGRVLAEHWADGPKSETPPGHWNVIANLVADHPKHARRLFGGGPVVDALEWDVKTYFVLNGALHDAAIAAWEIKRRFDCARPISLVRYMASRGQSSEPAAPDYSVEGLPLIPGLIERITAQSAQAQHAHLAHFQGELAVRSWRGEPGNRTRDIGGIAWIRAAEWLPYQRRSFVTPAFPGFVSGHSTFSRAAAEVLAAITGSAFFPGGFYEFVAERDRYLQFERGPENSLRLQWATYHDAADQAGQSRLWGGIHIAPDDFSGRRVGHRVGLAALEQARPYFEGTKPLSARGSR